MRFKSSSFVLGITLALVTYSGVAFSQEKPVVAPQCRSVGEEFSVGGVPGRNGWDQSLINCCPGLTDRGRKEDYDGSCSEAPIGGGYIGRCIACGDGVCDKRFESKCNCPEDCKT